LDPPRVRPADAPADRFSAARAMADVRVIGREPHPMGSRANRAVRDHLVRRLTELELSPQVQAADAWERLPGRELALAGGRVENVVGVLPGLDRNAPAVLMMAHYDSVPGSPGAADDAAGVASMLEIARALKAGDPPGRDVIFVFTDGEEVGLLGARAFFTEHPLARRVGFVINLEARGGSGRALMFQTGPENGETVRLFARSAARPIATSLSQFIYERMPNDTDFTVPMEAGIPGLNFAFVGRQFEYHSPTATPERLDQGSLQDLGAQGLAAVRQAVGAEALPARSGSAVYSQLAAWVVAYPPAVGWLILAVSAVLLLLAAVRARRLDAAASWIDVAQGAGALLYILLLAAALLRVARRATGVPSGYLEQFALLARAPLFETALIVTGLAAALYAAAALARGKGRIEAAVIPATAGLACSLFGGFDALGAGVGAAAAVLGLVTFGRPASLPGAWAGVLALGFIAACAAQAAAPTAAVLLVWPIALASASAALVALAAVKSFVDSLIATVIAALGLAWLGPYLHLSFQAMDLPEMLALFAALAALFVWPLAHPRIGGGGRLTALALLIAGLALIGVIRFAEPWSARHPQPVTVAYVLDAAQRQAWRVASTGEDSEYARQVLTADGGTIERRPLPPLYRDPVTLAPASWVEGPAPAASLATGVDGAQLVSLLPPGGARSLTVELRATVALNELTIEGKPTGLAAAAGEWTRLRWVGDPDGLSLSFRPEGSGRLELRYWSAADAWPGGAAALPSAPRNVMPFGASGATFVVGALQAQW
ncbi:M20/M25/M40 family metallo-hydrolase, partial [Phenylobacterium sp.]|uniref:M20/M25/M40 family metallo-hydrolase n=1 Tax=Phenylobacterium sp. TaxID=1871053 RepID=UPI002E2F900C